MSFEKDKSEDFNGVSGFRKKDALSYINSEEFYKKLESETRRFIKLGRSYVLLATPGDAAIRESEYKEVEAVFKKLKENYPELDHFRLYNNGNILLDTKKNTFMRRMWCNDIDVC